MDELIQLVEEKHAKKTELPEFKAGDTVNVHYKIKEGDKVRIQQFQGVVIKIKGERLNKSFVVRKIASGVGVERIFPMFSPQIETVEVKKLGKVRRAKLYYLRGLTGKKARIREKIVLSK